MQVFIVVALLVIAVSCQSLYKKEYAPKQQEFRGYNPAPISKPYNAYPQHDYRYNYVYPIEENEPVWEPKTWPKIMIFLVRLRKMIHF
ncbi:hypothetical protein DAPPUDRAFT_324650 [Daphnia pulex]|uniref:Uncharacterized protein n=1 Tax=Daphnia pulex TaxID=6669 RepID=E9H2C5_DAPPU|nr:hypothetical protein DAPPUDRAFT_324650 [Daphnia pulex]|eukprot:EFX74167.1 hypothetical protein DAPPUDRAFT_324650 [Daphnia pulex]